MGGSLRARTWQTARDPKPHAGYGRTPWLSNGFFMKMQSRAPHNLLTSNTLEGLLDVCTEIVEILDAHRKAQKAVGEAHREP